MARSAADAARHPLAPRARPVPRLGFEHAAAHRAHDERRRARARPRSSPASSSASRGGGRAPADRPASGAATRRRLPAPRRRAAAKARWSSMSVTGRIAHAPAARPAQYAFTPAPNGLTTPSPVTTTASCAAEPPRDEARQRVEGGEVRGQILGFVQDDAEALLDGDRQLDEVERVEADGAVHALGQRRGLRSPRRRGADRTSTARRGSSSARRTLLLVAWPSRSRCPSVPGRSPGRRQLDRGAAPPPGAGDHRRAAAGLTRQRQRDQRTRTPACSRPAPALPTSSAAPRRRAGDGSYAASVAAHQRARSTAASTRGAGSAQRARRHSASHSSNVSTASTSARSQRPLGQQPAGLPERVHRGGGAADQNDISARSARTRLRPRPAARSEPCTGSAGSPPAPR